MLTVALIEDTEYMGEMLRFWKAQCLSNHWQNYLIKGEKDSEKNFFGGRNI